jgi:hypothetical protein
VWLFWPARAESKWKTVGPFRRRKAEDIGEVGDRGGGDDGGGGGEPDTGARAAGLRDS